MNRINFWGRWCGDFIAHSTQVCFSKYFFLLLIACVRLFQLLKSSVQCTFRLMSKMKYREKTLLWLLWWAHRAFLFPFSDLGVPDDHLYVILHVKLMEAVCNVWAAFTSSFHSLLHCCTHFNPEVTSHFLLIIFLMDRVVKIPSWCHFISIWIHVFNQSCSTANRVSIS